MEQQHDYPPEKDWVPDAIVIASAVAFVAAILGFAIIVANVDQHSHHVQEEVREATQ